MSTLLIERGGRTAPGGRQFSLYATIVGASLLIALNPVVTGFAVEMAIPLVAYLLVLDLCLAAIIAAAVMHMRTANSRYFWFAIVGIGMTPVILIAAEIAISYAEVRYQRGWHGHGVSGVFEPDAQLAWKLIPNGAGREFSSGNFDTTYETDAQGRRKVLDASVDHPTIHVFGSSFTFGVGVKNDEVALYQIARAYRDRFRILNYSVSGYGLDQMVFDLEKNQGSFAADDIVVLAPTPVSVSWNLIENSFPCQFTIRTNELPVGRYPFLTDAGWQFVDLRKACGVIETSLLNSPLPLGRLFSRYHLEATRAATLEHADRLFARARRLVEAHGARFLPIMIVNADECRMKQLEYDLSGLKTPVVSMMKYCPTDEAQINTLRFPTDGHFSVEGNRWFAGVLEKILLNSELSLR
jgi:hypothetical protein